MSHQLNRLLKAFCQAEKGPPADLQKFIAKLPEPGALLSPWDSWALIGLIQYQRKRQRWVAEFIRTHLLVHPGEFEGGNTTDDFEERQVWGYVPERPEWRYVFYGDAYSFSNQDTGEVIEMSYWLDPPEYTYGSDYHKNFQTLRHLEPEEVRLKELFTRPMLLGLAWDDLVAAKALKRLSRKWPSRERVTEKVLGNLDAIDSFLRRWREPDHGLWLSALIGDWLAADALAKNLPQIQKITGKRKEQTEQLRRDRLTGDGQLDEFTELFGLVDLGAADQSLARAFQDSPSELSLAALKIAEEQNDGRWCLAAHDLLTRLDPEGRDPQPEIWVECLKYLFKHEFKKEVLLMALAKTERETIGDGVLLALEYARADSPEDAPDLALQLIRRGLRSEIHYCRIQTAMILAFMDQSWSRRDLWQLLSDTHDRRTTIEVRAALRELGDPASEAAVAAWEEKNLWADWNGTAEIDGEIRTVSQARSVDRTEMQTHRVRIRELRESFRDRLLRIREQRYRGPEN